MKILKPAIPQAERWYGQPITCPHCRAVFTLDERDFGTGSFAPLPWQMIDSGNFIYGPCPDCSHPVTQERPA